MLNRTAQPDAVTDMRFVHSIPCWTRGCLCLVLFIAACRGDDATLTRFEDSSVIDSMLTAAPHFVVNTDISAQTLIANKMLGLPNDSLILGRPRSLIAVRDSLYVVDQQSGSVLAIGPDGYLQRQIGRQGKGPGEFTNLWEIHYNGSNAFTYEDAKIQVFSEIFDYANSFTDSFRFRLGGIAVSPAFMLMQCPTESDQLICARSNSPPYAWLKYKQLLPALELPDRSGENSYNVAISPHGNRIAVGYKGLPYIFIYDDRFAHLHTIRFEGKDVRDFEPTVGATVPGVQEPGTRVFISRVKFLDNSYLAARVYGTGTYVINVSDNEYQLEGKFAFRPVNDSQNRKIIHPSDMILHRDHLYVASPFAEYVYGYDFEL